MGEDFFVTHISGNKSLAHRLLGQTQSQRPTLVTKIRCLLTLRIESRIISIDIILQLLSLGRLLRCSRRIIGPRMEP